MKTLSNIVAVIGLILFLAALIARFFGSSKLFLLGTAFSSANLLLITNTMFLIGIFLRLQSKEQ